MVDHHVLIEFSHRIRRPLGYGLNGTGPLALLHDRARELLPSILGSLDDTAAALTLWELGQVLERCLVVVLPVLLLLLAPGVEDLGHVLILILYLLFLGRGTVFYK
jgi:hypothetical protein